MATTIIPPASGVLAARTRQVFQFITDAYVTTAGDLAELNKPLNTIPSDGETIIFEWDTESVTFTFKSVPVNETDIDIKGTTAEQVTEMVLVISRNFKIFTNYLIEDAGSSNFRLTARVTGVLYSLTFSGTGSGNFLSGVNTPGVDAIYETPFSFYADLYKSNTLLVQEAHKADTSQTGLYDPANVLLANLSYTLPTYNASALALDTTSLALFTLRVWEFYDDAATAGETYGPFLAHLGGLKEKETTTIDYDERYFSDALQQNFLTRIPRTSITVSEIQQLFLYYYQKEGLGDGYVYVRIFHTDGTFTDVDPKFTLTQPGSIIIIPAGYTQMGIDSHKTAGKTVDTYEIIVYYGSDLQSGIAFSENFIITPDFNYYAYNRYFLFANSVGGFDSLWCKGQTAYAIEADGEDYNRYPDINTSTVIKGARAQNRSVVGQKMKSNTGWMEKNVIDFYTRELLASEEVFEIIDGQFVKIIIDRSSVTDLYTDDEQVTGFSFEYTYAQEDTV